MKEEKPPLWQPVAVFAGMLLFSAILNWGLTKMLFGQAMALVGVDWAGMSDGDKLDAFLAFVIGVPSLTVGGLGAYLAWLAIEMGREQDTVTARQMEILEGQRELLEKSGKLEARQTEIAETHHQAAQAQMQRKAIVAMNMSGGLHGPEADGFWHYTVYIVNKGDKSAKDVQYELFFRHHIKFTHTLINGVSSRQLFVMSPHDGGIRRYAMVKGWLPMAIHPGAGIELGEIVSDADIGMFPLQWLVTTEDGRFPNGNYEKGHMIPVLYGMNKVAAPMDNSGRTP